MLKRLVSGALCALLSLAFAFGASAEVPRGTFYEVYVRAYADSDGDGIGDLPGLTGKLDYLADLGVRGLWLMPVFEARSDHGYDVTDYTRIDPDYGTNDDMRALLQAAHERGIAVIVDFVINHTSSEHPWFKDALAGGEKRDWYRFFDEATDSETLLSAKPWGSPVWHDSDGGKYYGIFWEGMPDLNLDNEAVKAEIYRIGRYWLEMGVDGFRLDATSHLFAFGEEELKQDTARSGAWLKAFQSAMREVNPDCYIVGEAWEALSKRQDILGGIDSVLNFDFGEKLIDLLNGGGDANLTLAQMSDTLAACEQVNPDFLDAPFLTNHDQNRVLGQLKYKQERYRLAVGVLLTFPGNPFLYYGEEIGMLGAKPDEELRTPMLWGENDPAQCSFITSKYNKKTVPVATQQADAGSLWQYVRSLARLRAESQPLREGGFTPLDSGNLKLMAYERGEALLVIHNFSDQPQASALIPASAPIFGALTEDGQLPAMSTTIWNR